MSTVTRPPVRRNVPSYRPPTIGPAGARKPRTVKPAHGVARLTLTIEGTDYAVRSLTVDPAAEVSALIRLRKDDGTEYHVAHHPWGPECECPSFVFDHVDSDGACKHIAALRATHLLPADPGAWPDERCTVAAEGGVL